MPGVVGGSYQQKFTDSSNIRQELKQVLRAFHEKGYLGATFDSITRIDRKVMAYLTTGKRYQWIRLRQGNVSNDIWQQTGYAKSEFRGTPLHYKKVLDIQRQVITYLENHGYPFAEMKLDSIRWSGNKVSAKLLLRKNQLTRVDSIVIHSPEKVIHKNYLHQYLRIQKGEPYPEVKVNKIPDRLKQLEFLRTSQPYRVEFYKESAVVHLYLEKTQSSRINGVIGVLPNTETGQRINITGEFQLRLLNPFQTGKKMNLNYRGLPNQTQDLSIGFLWPYFVNTPLGIDLQGQFYKSDTSYLTVNGEVGIQYQLSGNSELKAYLEQKSSRLLEIDTQQIIEQRELPSNIDYRVTTYGLGATVEELDHRYNPRQGYRLLLKGGVGRKKIVRNNQIVKLEDPRQPGYEFSALYDSLERQTTTQYQLRFETDYFLPVAVRHVLQFSLQGAGLWGKRLFRNEVYRIGGMQSLRGFNEESIFASLYGIFTLEYHYLLGKNAYFYVFGDGGYYQYRVGQFLEDYPIGFGTGIRFQTNAGIFSMNYALGRQRGNPIDLRSGKIHFGYVNRF